MSSKRTPPSVNIRKCRTPCIVGENAEMVGEMGGKKRKKKKKKRKGKERCLEGKKKKEDGGMERK